MSRLWVHDAVNALEADFHRSADTHMIRLDLEHSPDTPIYLKDESTHPSGSLKHRLGRSLFLYGLCNGWITEGKPIVEASSGSTAVSEAYFARLLGLPFTAVVPNTTSRKKLSLIELYGGTWHLAEPNRDICEASQQLAEELGGHFMDQFTYAERATDWRGNNSIAESLFRQLKREPQPIPSTIVVSAGTGGTSATIGRFTRYFRLPSKLVVVDPENSVFFDYYHSRDESITINTFSRIEGIGRPYVEPSFLPDVVDDMFKVPDEASLAAMLFLQKKIGRSVGASTGTNLIGALNVLHFADASDSLFERGPVVTMICDGGERYWETYYNRQWREEHGLFTDAIEERIERFFQSGEWEPIGERASLR